MTPRKYRLWCSTHYAEISAANRAVYMSNIFEKVHALHLKQAVLHQQKRKPRHLFAVVCSNVFAGQALFGSRFFVSVPHIIKNIRME